MEDAFAALLAGNAVFFMEGYDHAMKFPARVIPIWECREQKQKRFSGVPEKDFPILLKQTRPCEETAPGYKNEGRGNEHRGPFKYCDSASLY